MSAQKLKDAYKRTDECLSDMKRVTGKFRAVANELEGNPACECANGVCECGERVIHPPPDEVEDITFDEWLGDISLTLEK